MKKIFLAYRFTGEDHNELKETLGKILTALRSAGHTVYCSIDDNREWFDEDGRTNGEIMERAFKQLDESDILLVFVRSNEKSEGMLMEIGYAIAKGKPFVLAIKKGIVTTSVTELARPLIEFDTLEDLCKKLKNMAL